MRKFLKATQRTLGRTSILHRAIRSVWTPPERVYRHLHFVGPFKVEVAKGAHFKIISHGNAIENDLFWRGYGGSWESASLKLWRDLVNRSEFILDVGANTGVYALAAQAIKPDAKVMAVEPSPRVFAKLRENVALNDFPIILEDAAASDRTGSATFYDFQGAHQYSASLEASMGGTIPTEVKVSHLDDILAKHRFPRVDLMKMDVEKHEAAALRGMRRYIERHAPIILIEILAAEVEAGVRQALSGVPYRWSQIPGEEGRNFLLTPN